MNLSQSHHLSRPRTVIILCCVLELEIEHFASGLDHIAKLQKLDYGLHLDPPRLKCELQKTIDSIEEDDSIEAIALGYGVCSRGTEGVRTSRCRLVVPRAHDCITLLLGSRHRYAQYVAKHPGTYWYSPGWNKHHVPPGKQRYENLYAEYVEKYGEDNAKYLMETEQQWFSAYDRATYVDVGVGDNDADYDYTCRCADWLGWSVDRQRGDPELLQALVECRWDEDRFLVLEPGQVFRLTNDQRVIEVCKDE